MMIDIVFLLAICICFYLGYTKGILKSTFGILSILMAILVTLKFSFLLIGFFENSLKLDARLALILGFVVCFLLIMLLIRVIGRGVEQMLETAHINFINKLAGGVASAFIAMALFSSVIWFMNQIKLIGSSTKESSKTYPVLESFPEKSKWIWSKTKPLFSEFWTKSNRILDGLEPSEKTPERTQQDSL